MIFRKKRESIRERVAASKKRERQKYLQHNQTAKPTTTTGVAFVPPSKNSMGGITNNHISEVCGAIIVLPRVIVVAPPFLSVLPHVIIKLAAATKRGRRRNNPSTSDSGASFNDNDNDAAASTTHKRGLRNSNKNGKNGENGSMAAPATLVIVLFRLLLSLMEYRQISGTTTGFSS